MKSAWKNYRKTGVTPMTPVDKELVLIYNIFGELWLDEDRKHKVSISTADRENGSPKVGDMIARNEKDPNDCWLVAESYFKDNYEEV